MYGLAVNVHVKHPGTPFLLWRKRAQRIAQSIKATRDYLHVPELVRTPLVVMLDYTTRCVSNV